MALLIFCSICGECLGKHRPFYGKEHMKKYPNHDEFLVKNIIDPLVLDDPDEWFLTHKNKFNKILHISENNRSFTEDKDNHRRYRTLKQ